jgi:hypothetical protein
LEHFELDLHQWTVELERRPVAAEQALQLPFRLQVPMQVDRTLGVTAFSRSPWALELREGEQGVQFIKKIVPKSDNECGPPTSSDQSVPGEEYR